MLVPSTPGGSVDTLARTIGPKLSERWGQQFIVENRAGASGTIAGELTAKAPPDGYLLLLGTISSLATNVVLQKKLPYDPVKDFAPVSLVATQNLMLVVHPSVPAKTVGELVRFAKSQPGKLSFASAGNGTGSHLSGELFKQVAGVNIQGVMYKGSSQVVNDLLGNQIQLSVDGIPANLPHVKAGKLRVLASTGSSRAPQLPDVPTVAELGYPGFSGEGWGGVVVTRSTPMEIVNKVSADLRKVLSDPAMQQRLVAAGLVVDNQPRDEWISFARQTLVTWGEVARRNNIKID